MTKNIDLLTAGSSRRRFLAGAGALGAAALVTGCSDSGTVPTPTPTPTPTPQDVPDNDILNFALNLEYLEAEFYLRASTGTGLSATDALTGAGTVTGGTQVTFSSALYAQYAAEIAQNELNHVRALQATIKANGGTPVARPAIDFTNGFTMLAGAAGISGSFNPFSGTLPFLLGAFVFEDVGVTAYSGAAPAITNSNILTAAAGIAAVEAYHAAEIRALIVASGDATTLANANKISVLRGTLGGGNETTLSSTGIVAASATTAVGFARTTSQVLHIVYGSATAGTKSGVFFPNGLNGTITVAS